MFHGHLDYFLNHLLELCLTQNRVTMALWKFTTVDLLYFIMWKDPTWIETHPNSIGWGPGHIWFHTTLEGMWPHYMILEVSWDGLWTLSFGLSQVHGHGSWLVCEVAMSLGMLWMLCLALIGWAFHLQRRWSNIVHFTWSVHNARPGF